MNLSVADLLVVPAILPPPSLHGWWLRPTGASLRACIVLSFCLLILSLSGSLATLFVIAVDRYLAVLQPLRYKTVLTPCRARCIIGALWIVLLALVSYLLCVGFTTDVQVFLNNAVDPFAWIPYMVGSILFRGLYPASLVCIIALYGRIAVAVVRQSRLITAKVSPGQHASPPLADAKTRRSLRIMASIVLALVVCCAPSTVFCNVVGPHSDAGTMTVHHALLLLLCSGTWLDPLLYARQSRDMRRAYQRLLGRGGTKGNTGATLAPACTTTVSTLSGSREV